MSETGAIDDAQYQAALAEPIIASGSARSRSWKRAYVAEMVRAEMVARFGNAATTAGSK
jgi:penicillin-binding protein 1A